jgi:ankyrin repeat protein
MGCGASKDGELLRACQQGELGAAQRWLSSGANPNGAPGAAEDALPLAAAALAGHLPLVELLLDRGADVNVRLGRVRARQRRSVARAG